MLKRLSGLMIAAILGVALLYISRFWMFDLWSQDGLFGIGSLRPQGNLLAGWLWGTALAPFDLLLWVVGSFFLLTVASKSE
tara:strand:+ start:2665 stop:2907 length:243 start_codon:yes stop_codon:yes gene_type:complete